MLPIAYCCPGGASTERRASWIDRQTEPPSRIPTGSRLIRLIRKPAYASARNRSEFVASAQRGRARLIAVVLGSPDAYTDVRKLLNYGFASRG